MVSTSGSTPPRSSEVLGDGDARHEAREVGPISTALRPVTGWAARVLETRYWIGGVVRIETIPIERLNPAPYKPRKDLRPGDPEYDRLLRSLVA